MTLASAALAAAALALAAGPAAAGPYRPPRTPFGQPDLEGIWTNSSVTGLERPDGLKTLTVSDKQAAAYEAQFQRFLAAAGISDGPVDPKAPTPTPVKTVANSEWVEMSPRLARIDGKARTSWIVEPADGKLPFTAAGRRTWQAFDKHDGADYASYETRPTEERCLTGIGSPEGPPMMNTGYDANYEILQTPDDVVIEVEMNHEVRIIRLKDRTHPPASVTKWMGDSVGWWEGDTLVVETTNLDPRGAHISTLQGGFVYSPKAKVVERFTRTAPNQILYQFTVEDPATFARPWRAEMPFRPAKGPIYEYACHEGNYSLPNILAGARERERLARAQAQAGLAAPRP